MGDRTGIVNKYTQLIKDLGRSAVSSLYPNDIEYYLCAFELVSSDGTESYFMFPIQPSSIQKSEPTRTNIKKSLAGVTVLKNSSFIPQELSLKGNFGKRFKIISGLDGVAFNKSKKNNVKFDVPTLSNSIKTGFGAIKILQKILADSNKFDSVGKPKKLYFYNLGLGESYLVTVSPFGISFSQTEDTNMIWQYNISLTILSPLSVVTGIGSDVMSANRAILSRGAIQKTINAVANDVRLLIQTSNF